VSPIHCTRKVVSYFVAVAVAVAVAVVVVAHKKKGKKMYYVQESDRTTINKITG